MRAKSRIQVYAMNTCQRQGWIPDILRPEPCWEPSTQFPTATTKPLNLLAALSKLKTAFLQLEHKNKFLLLWHDRPTHIEEAEN